MSDQFDQTPRVDENADDVPTDGVDDASLAGAQGSDQEGESVTPAEVLHEEPDNGDEEPADGDEETADRDEQPEHVLNVARGDLAGYAVAHVPQRCVKRAGIAIDGDLADAAGGADFLAPDL